MHTPATTRPLDLDWVLSLACLALAAATLHLLWTDAGGTEGEDPSTRPVGRVSFTPALVRRRAAGSLVWRDVATGASLHARDALFVPPGAAATLELEGGTELTVEENSLVVLEHVVPAQRPLVALLHGGLAGSGGRQGLAIRGEGATLELARDSRARLEALEGEPTQVQVYGGQATLTAGQERVALGAHEARRVAGGRVAPLAWTAGLASPQAQARIVYSGTPPPVTLAFSAPTPGLRVQVARGRRFQRPLLEGPAQDGTLEFRAPAPGGYWWRVVDAQGEPASEARSFTLVAQLPPRPLSPLEGETVDLSRTGALPFAWSSEASAERYVLEVAAEPTFREPLLVEEARGASLRLASALPEGVYHWRVRAQAQGAPPWSPPTSFRLLHRPLLDAPELIPSELEVKSGSGDE